MTVLAQGNTRQRNLLIVFAAVLLITAWRFVGPILGFGGNDATLPVAAQGPIAGAERLGTHPGDRVAVLRMANLDRVSRESTRGRDPWSFVDPPRQPIRSLLPQSKPHESIAAVQPAKVAEPLQQPADFNLQYLGRFGPPDKQIAVFTRGKEIFNKQEGEVIDNQFIVEHIGYEAVDIRFVGFPEVPGKRVGVTRRRPD